MSEEEKKITLQAIFDAAVQHFLIEGNPPGTEDQSCRYLTSDGKKCAVGLVLPEGHPSQASALGFADLVQKFPALFDEYVVDLARDDRFLINNFQRWLHDSLQREGKWLPWVERVGSYAKIAEKHGLTFEPHAA